MLLASYISDNFCSSQTALTRRFIASQVRALFSTTRGTVNEEYFNPTSLNHWVTPTTNGRDQNPDYDEDNMYNIKSLYDCV